MKLRFLAVTICLLSFSIAALAQLETGSVSGVVKDSSGAVISGAQVSATSQGTGAARTATSDSAGLYTISSLPPGLYELKVSQKGFGDFRQKVSISPGLASGIDATLSAAGTETVVEVVGKTETQVDTETSAISQTVDTTRVSSLPSLTRNPYDFVQTMGNVNQDPASGSQADQAVRGAGVSINGQRSASTDALLDGGDNVNLYDTTVGQPVPLDAVQEFSITSNNFSAEYGRASGGVINVVTKSGTNDFHGSLYEFNRTSATTSNDVDDIANNVPKAKYTRNQFGYSVGGPIIKSKLFFFSSTEFTRVRSAANIQAAAIDPAFIAASDPATRAVFAPFKFRAGSVVSQRLNAAGAGVVPDTDPTACSTPDCGAAIAAYAATGGPIFDIVSYQTPSDSGGGSPQNTYNMVHRIDFNMTDKTTMYGRYALLNLKDFDGFVNNSPYDGYDTGLTEFYQNFQYTLSHVWTPSLVTESKLSINRLNLQEPLASTQPVQPSFYFSYAVERSVNGYATCMPGYACTTPGNAIPFGGPQNTFQFSQSVSWNHGKHDFRFGGMVMYTKDNRTFGAYENAVEALEPFGFSELSEGLDNLLTGGMGWFQVVIDPQGKFPCQRGVDHLTVATPACKITLPATQPSFTRSNRYGDYALYAQDTWKLRRNLTLNLGVRWEYYGVQHNADPNLDSNFVFGSGGTIFDKLRNGQVDTVPNSPVGGLWNKDLNNFAPRVGFAWDVFGDGKTSLRGGYGIAYERNFGNVTFNVIQNPPAQFNSNFPAAEQPITSNNLGPFAGNAGLQKSLPPPSLRDVRQDIPTAYSESWNLSLQRQVLHNSLFALEYTGSNGIHLYTIENLNQQGTGVTYLGTDTQTAQCAASVGILGFNGCTIDRFNRQYGNINARGFGGFSRYNALNTRFVSSNLFHQGLDLTVNYTYSHTIDNLSSTFSESPQTENLGLLDPFQPALDKGSADYDARHRVAVSAVWAPPYAHGTHGVLRQVADGWDVAPIIIAHTGNPFTVFDSSNDIGDTVAARYFVPAGTTVPLSGSTSTAAPLSPNNYAYMTLPASATYVEALTGSGELPTCSTATNAAGHTISTGQNCLWPSNMTPRNAFLAPGAYNINLAIGKNFPITERFKLQFRSEFYNLFNHSNYYVQPGGTQDAGNTFCSVLNGAGCAGFPIQGKIGVVPTGGVPNERRFIQFALKLLF